MFHILITFALFLGSQQLAANIKLLYPTSVPIQQISSLTLEIEESLPIFHLSTKAQQVLKYEISLSPSQTLAPQNAHSLNFNLKDIFIDLNVNQEKSTFESSTKQAANPLMQLSKLIDQPLLLQINSQGCLSDTPELKNIFKRFPALKNIPFKSFLNELFRSLFALHEKNLKVGDVFQQNCSGQTTEHLLDQITYEITDITDQKISAKIKGTIPPSTSLLNVSLQFNEQQIEKIEMLISGLMQGEVTWDRQNALLYALNTHYTGKAQLKAADLLWNMSINLTHQVTSYKPTPPQKK